MKRTSIIALACILALSSCRKEYICECSSEKNGVFETNTWKDRDNLGYDYFKKHCDATASARSTSRSTEVTCILK